MNPRMPRPSPPYVLAWLVGSVLLASACAPRAPAAAPSSGGPAPTSAAIPAAAADASGPGGPPVARAPAGNAPAGAPAATPVTRKPVRAAFTSFSASAAPWWMAQEHGYFSQEGLDVELRQIAAGATLLAAM